MSPYLLRLASRVAHLKEAQVVAERVAAALDKPDEDSPQALVLDAIDYIDLTFRDEWNRPATREEITAILRGVALDVDDTNSSWPRNLWVDAISEAFEVGNDVVLALPEEKLAELSDLWDKFTEASEYHEIIRPRILDEGAPPLPDVAEERFLDCAGEALDELQEEAEWLTSTLPSGGKIILAAGKKLRVYDFDETLAVATGFITIIHSDGEKITIDSATFAYFRPVEGDSLDFGAFNDIHKPRKIKKNWEPFVADAEDADTDVVILTARPKGSASALQKYLESEGVKGVKVVALQSSDPYDKARWIDRAIDDGGYKDIKFVDDSTRNAAAVAEHGEHHKERGLHFESIHSPHPSSDEEFLGSAADKSWSSDEPTTAISEIKAKPSADKSEKKDEKGGKAKPSEWWTAQTPEFHKSYCRDHSESKYCTASEGRVAAKDPNAALKKDIEARAKKSKNRKVLEYAESFVAKLDLAGPAAGAWVDQVEHDFESIAKKSEGLLKGFKDDDYDTLYKVLFGVDRPKKKGKKGGMGHTAAWKPTGDGKRVGIFLPLPPGLAQQFPDLGPQDDSPPHITLLYVGEVPRAKEELFTSTLLSVLSKEPGPIRAELGAVDHFVHPHQNRQVFYSSVRFSRDLSVIRDRIRFALEAAGFTVMHSFPLAFFPHVTLGYVEDVLSRPQWKGVSPIGMWDFESVDVWGLSKPLNVMFGTYESESNALTKMPMKTASQRVASRFLTR